MTTDAPESDTTQDPDATHESDTAQPPVDLDAFREEMRAAGIEAIVDSTIETFVQEGVPVLSELNAGVQAGNLKTVRASAHFLKSSAAIIRATRLSKIMEEIELAAAADRRALVEERHPSAQREFARVLAYLDGRSETDVSER